MVGPDSSVTIYKTDNIGLKSSTKYLRSSASNLTLAIQKQELHAFETIQACETAHKVQA